MPYAMILDLKPRRKVAAAASPAPAIEPPAPAIEPPAPEPVQPRVEPDAFQELTGEPPAETALSRFGSVLGLKKKAKRK